MKSKIKQKHIEGFLEDIAGFDLNEKDKFHLEQHKTPADLAANMIFQIYNREQDNINDAIVTDLGCGTGSLLCGMGYLEPQMVIGIDIDQKYLNICKNTFDEKFEDNLVGEFILADISKLGQTLRNVQIADILVMNPPFGTKIEGIDYLFIQAAMKLCSGNIYSLHKSSTREFLQKKAKENNYNFELVDEYQFPLPFRFKNYHKKNLAFTEVDFICFSPKNE